MPCPARRSRFRPQLLTPPDRLPTRPDHQITFFFSGSAAWQRKAWPAQNWAAVLGFLPRRRDRAVFVYRRSPPTGNRRNLPLHIKRSTKALTLLDLSGKTTLEGYRHYRQRTYGSLYRWLGDTFGRRVQTPQRDARSGPTPGTPEFTRPRPPFWSMPAPFSRRRDRPSRRRNPRPVP